MEPALGSLLSGEFDSPSPSAVSPACALSLSLSQIITSFLKKGIEEKMELQVYEIYHKL